MILPVDARLKCGALDTQIECSWKAFWGNMAIVTAGRSTKEYLHPHDAMAPLRKLFFWRGEFHQYCFRGAFVRECERAWNGGSHRHKKSSCLAVILSANPSH